MRKSRLIFFSFLAAFFALNLFAEEVADNASPKDPDGGWPRLIESENGSKTKIYQPQVETWRDQKELIAWSAVEFLASGRTKSEMGVVEWSADTSVAKEERLVKFENIQMRTVNFPTLDQAKAREATTSLQGLFPKEGLVISLDRILAAVDKSVINTSKVKINQAPPPIFYASRPAKLVQFDGEPILSPIKDSPLKYVINTNWDILQDPDKGLFYMRDDKYWYSAKAVDQEWDPVTKLPESFLTLPKDGNWDEVFAAMPPKKINKKKAPLLYVSKLPAELIVTTGKPKTEKVGDSKLLWIKNTEVDLFQMKRGAYYFLTSGRWFKAEKLEGPWTFATADLPKEFLNIPRTHPRAQVRTAIPGTDEANEAVILAQIPQTLTISRKDLESPKVKYDGEPKFKAIKDTKVSYATNCSNDVLKVGDMYYLCFQGAWFQSKKVDGPWDLASSVPEDIYKIPEDCPVFHVTYVRCGASTPESVTYSCSSGYSGVTVSFGVAMWGTGWYYPPYYGYGGYYPVYYPYYPSYGGNARYNPRTGAYGYGSSVSGPNGGIARTAMYNPNTGTYSRGKAAWGENGAKFSGQAYNPRTGTSASTRQGMNSNGSWGTTKVSRGDDWVQRGHAKTDSGKVSGVRTSEGNGMIRGSGENGSGFVGKKGDDIYAGKDGNVYKKTENGWQQHTDDGWTDVDRGQTKPGTSDQKPGVSTNDQQRGDRVNNGATAGTRDQLNRDAGARDQGNQRVKNSSNYNRGSSSSRPSSGSYNRGGGSYGGGSRGSYGGGGMRGGGGGRRR